MQDPDDIAPWLAEESADGWLSIHGRHADNPVAKGRKRVTMRLETTDYDLLEKVSKTMGLTRSVCAEHLMQKLLRHIANTSSLPNGANDEHN